VSRSAVRFAVALAFAVALSSPLAAQCDPGGGLGGAGADVIVSDLLEPLSYGSAGGYFAYSVGTQSCNIGTVELLWEEDVAAHPVIAQNLYRLSGGRFEQIGLSWLKHGFTALQLDECGCACVPSTAGGTRLGVGCSDPYIAQLNGNQNALGSRSEVFDPAGGGFIYPPILDPANVDLTWRRLRVAESDLDPLANPGALYYAESHYISPDDAAAGNAHNNASHRAVAFATDASRTMSYSGATQLQLPGIAAWAAQDPSVTLSEVLDGDGGLLILGTKVTDLGGGQYAYEYALYNHNSTRAVRSFALPLPAGASVASLGFHDVEYHSGEPYSGADWGAVQGAGSVEWSTAPYAQDPNANALRYATLYNFRFVASSPPVAVTARLGLFEPGLPASLDVPTFGLAGDYTLPVTGLSCTLDLPGVDIAWTNGEGYDSVQVLRDGAVIATLPGSATAYTDPQPPPGARLYGVRGSAAGVFSFPVECAVSIPLPLAISLPNGPLALVEPTGGDAMAVDIAVTPGYAIEPGSERLWVDAGSGYAAAPLVALGGSAYDAVFPASPCRTTLSYYVSAESTGGIPVTFPAGGAAAPLVAESAYGVVETFDPLDAPGGWLVGPPNTASAGHWVHGDPNGTTAQPEDDHSAAGENCWFTGQGSPGGAATAADVDGSTASNGLTTLYSPLIDLSALSDPTISYWRWYSNDQGTAPGLDVFTVEASENGLDWVTVEVVGPTGPEASGGWYLHTFRVLDFIALGASSQVRFIASDLGAGSVVEAAIDDFTVRDLICIDPDCNGNGIDDVIDIATGTSLDADGDGTPDECESPSFRRGDANASGSQDIADAVTMLSVLFAGAPDPCPLALDANGDGAVNIADPIRLLGYLFSGGAPLPPPFPGCGTVVTALPCAAFPACP